MDLATKITIVIGVLGLLATGFGLFKQVQSTTAADRDRAANDLRDQIRQAREEERTACSERLQALKDRLAEMTADRDAERDRANSLQTLINQSRLGGTG